MTTAAQPPFEYLATASQASLEGFEIARLNQISTIRKEIAQALEAWIAAEADVRLTRWLLERRKSHDQDLRCVRETDLAGESEIPSCFIGPVFDTPALPVPAPLLAFSQTLRPSKQSACDRRPRTLRRVSTPDVEPIRRSVAPTPQSAHSFDLERFSALDSAPVSRSSRTVAISPESISGFVLDVIANELTMTPREEAQFESNFDRNLERSLDRQSCGPQFDCATFLERSPDPFAALAFRTPSILILNAQSLFNRNSPVATIVRASSEARSNGPPTARQPVFIPRSHQKPSARCLSCTIRARSLRPRAFGESSFALKSHPRARRLQVPSNASASALSNLSKLSPTSVTRLVRAKPLRQVSHLEFTLLASPLTSSPASA